VRANPERKATRFDDHAPAAIELDRADDDRRSCRISDELWTSDPMQAITQQQRRGAASSERDCEVKE
jgi:hypothetical protein